MKKPFHNNLSQTLLFCIQNGYFLLYIIIQILSIYLKRLLLGYFPFFITYTKLEEVFSQSG